MEEPCGLKTMNILSNFEELTCKPVKFLSPQDDVSLQFRSCSKELYDFAKKNETSSSTSSTLSELLIRNFDDEQVWQQIELQNAYVHKLAVEKTASLLVDLKCTLFQRQFEYVKRQNAQKDMDEAGGDDDDANSEELNFGSDIDDLDKTGSDLGDEDDFGLDIGDPDNSGSEDENLDRFGLDDDNDDEGDADEHSLSPSKKPKEEKLSRKRGFSSVVDDRFFKLSQLEDFLNAEDEREAKRGKHEDATLEDSKDYFFDDVDSEEESDNDDVDDDAGKKSGSKQLKYDDFFDSLSDGSDREKNADKNDFLSEHVADSGIDRSGDRSDSESFEDLEENDESANKDEDDFRIGHSADDNTVKSSFEKRQDMLKQHIASLEEQNLAEKSWQMKGEVIGSARPENSLLQEHLSFEHTQRQAPVITKETTELIEDIIKQRIKDQTWDDVERKVKVKEDPFEYRKRIILDQEKSKASLAEIYEQEFIKQQQTDKEEKEDPAHQEIKTMMASLFKKLDALSNFHFTPKMAAPEIKIVSNLPSITVEEVAPVTATTAQLLAPGEILPKSTRELKGSTERDKTDKLRDRRHKKINQRVRRKDRESREKLASKMDKTNNKYNKEKILKGLVANIEKKEKGRKSELSSSKAVFSRLNEMKNNPKPVAKKGKKNVNYKL